MPTKKKYKDYAEYLKSDKWAQVKEDYTRNHNHEGCAICSSEDNLQHHHFCYPKNWNDDSYKNIIKLCGECHSMAHDVPHENTTLIDFISKITPLKIHQEHLNGTVAGQDEVLIRALQVVDVIEERNLTNKNYRPTYRFKANMKVSQTCGFLPLSLWENITNG